MSHATMMAANVLAHGHLGSHLSRPHATNDSRLLLNLIKTERAYISHLHASVSSAHAASTALSAWGTSEAPDVTETSAKLSSLLSACADVQDTHVQAIEGYRAALKDVADREASIRNVIRDRDILVGRLIKASNKAANVSGKSKKSPEERAEKVSMAQRELQSCEDVLAQEEAALVGVKRRTFKEALTMRMKTMGDAGAAMVEAAQEAILLLDAFDSNAHQMPHSPSMYNDYNMSNSIEQNWDPYHQQQYDQSQQYDQQALYDQQAQYDHQPQPLHQHPHQQYDSHPQDPHQQYIYHDAEGGAHVDERAAPINQHFEVASVTPSQSASQIYQPMYQSRHSNIYSTAPYNVGNENGLDTQRQSQSMQQQQPHHHHHQHPHLHQQHQMHNRQQDDESDSDNEEDWRRSFNPNQNNVIQSGGHPSQLPAPHQLSANVGTHRTFMPYASANEITPGPTPPAKDSNKQLVPSANSSKAAKKKRRSSQVQERNEQFGPPNMIAMPPIPTAPRLNPDGVHVGDIPTAPKLYMQGASGDQDDSSSEEDVAIPLATSMGHKWPTRHIADEASSDGGRTARQSTQIDGSVKRSNSFFGRMGRLFKTDVKVDGEPKGEKKERLRRSSHGSSNWNTRTDALVKESRKYASKDSPSNLSKRQGALSRPIAREEADSSEDEPIDERNLIRVKNPKRPMWQAPKAGSDVGNRNALTDELKRPESIRRSSSNQVEEVGKGKAEDGLIRSNTITTAAVKKKKKKSTIAEGGSKRAASLDGDNTTRVSSIVMTGDSSAGVRRSESITSGAQDIIKKKKKSKRISTASAPLLYGDPKIGSMSAIEGDGKFTTSNWVAKPGVVKDSPVANSSTGVNQTNASIKTSSITAPISSKPKASEEDTAPKHVPQPSATMSPPIKPALKVPGSTELTRTGSVASSMAGLTSLPPPISAPPPVSSMILPSDLEFSSKHGSAFQSTKVDTEPAISYQSKNIRDLDISDQVSKEIQDTSQPLPQIDAPSSQPLKLNIEVGKAGDDVVHSNLERSELNVNQQSGVSRITDRIASVGRGVFGLKSPSKEAVETTASSLAPGKLSRSYSDQNIALSSDSSEDEEETSRQKEATPAIALAPSSPIEPASIHQAGIAAPALSNSLPMLAPINTSLHPAPASDAGSGIGRRKSVRMAPDVKLPPETPTDMVGSREAPFESQLSSRIAPPPTAPPRLNVQQDRPIDISSQSREVQGWTVRAAPLDDSSDDDVDEYNQARKAFGVSKSYGKAPKSPSKARKPSADVPTETASLGGDRTIKKKKKKKRDSASNFGYNPSVPLPPGVEIVGSSRRSIR